MTTSTTSIPAGWYTDPAGSEAQRWWDGTQWTTHLQQPAPVAPVAPVVPFSQTPVIAPPTFAPVAPAGYGQQVQSAAPVEQPEINLSAYQPGRGYADSPRDPNYETYGGSVNGSAGHYGNSRLMQSSHANNTIAWLSLVAGVLAIGAIFIRLALPNGSFYLPVFGLTAVISGIRAVSRYRSRRVTVLWAPIVGMVLGVTAEILLFSAILVPIGVASATNSGGSNSATTQQGEIGPTGTITVRDVGTGTPQYTPTSPTLDQATTSLSNMVQMLKADYAPGLTGAAADGKWPAQITHTTAGAVHSSDGRNFGDVIQPGWHLAYTVQSDGSYILAVSGPDTTELAAYSSRTDEYSTICEAVDPNCDTPSPVAPRTISDSDSSSGSTTTS